MTKKETSRTPSCSSCKVETRQRICYTKEGKSSKGCPTLTRKEVLEEANREYDLPEVHEFALQASRQEASCYANRDERPYVMQPTKTRIVEICEFAQKMKYRRIGLAFCIGLAQEAGIVEEIFKSHGLEVVSVLCKAGRTSKDTLGIAKEDKIFQDTDESMCNPIFQAKVNVLLGLCVGHDSLFFKYAEAPTTVLAVKDRVTGHNPLAAIYLSNSYYKKLNTPGK